MFLSQVIKTYKNTIRGSSKGYIWTRTQDHTGHFYNYRNMRDKIVYDRHIIGSTIHGQWIYAGELSHNYYHQKLYIQVRKEYTKSFEWDSNKLTEATQHFNLWQWRNVSDERFLNAEAKLIYNIRYHAGTNIVDCFITNIWLSKNYIHQQLYR